MYTLFVIRQSARAGRQLNGELQWEEKVVGIMLSFVGDWLRKGSWPPLNVAKQKSCTSSLITYSTARVYVNCADKFNALRRRVVRPVYTIFLRARSKKCAVHVFLLFSAISFFCISLLYETKVFKAWKSGEKATENLHSEKKLSCYTRASRVASRIFRITSSSSRFAWFELLMNQLGKENVTYLRHPNTSFTEQVTKKYSLIYFSTIHCNQHSLRCLRRGM